MDLFVLHVVHFYAIVFKLKTLKERYIHNILGNTILEQWHYKSYRLKKNSPNSAQELKTVQRFMYVQACNTLTIWLIFTKNMIGRVVRKYLHSTIRIFYLAMKCKTKSFPRINEFSSEQSHVQLLGVLRERVVGRRESTIQMEQGKHSRGLFPFVF